MGSLLLGWVPFLFTPAPCCLRSSEGLEALVGYRADSGKKAAAELKLGVALFLQSLT